MYLITHFRVFAHKRTAHLLHLLRHQSLGPPAINQTAASTNQVVGFLGDRFPHQDPSNLPTLLTFIMPQE